MDLGEKKLVGSNCWSLACVWSFPAVPSPVGKQALCVPAVRACADCPAYKPRREKHRGHLLPWNKDAERCVALVRKCGHYGDLKSVSLKRCDSFQTTHRWSHRWIQSQFCTSIATWSPKGNVHYSKEIRERDHFKGILFSKGHFLSSRWYYQELHKGSKWTISQTVFCKIVYLKHLLSYTSYY